MPVNLFSEYYVDQDSSAFITLDNSTLISDANGDIQFNWKLNKGSAGKWTIVFQVDGQYPIPLCFKTEWDKNATVSIIRQPTSDGIKPVGDYLNSNGGAIIEVRDSSNNPMENYMVTASVIPVDENGDKNFSPSRR